MNETRLTVIGDVMVDVVVVPHAPLAPTSDTPSTVRLARGGAGGNLAIAARAGGISVRFVGVRGDDVLGDWIAQEMQRRGLDLELLVDSSRPTGVVVSVVAPDGERMMLTDRGANASLSERSPVWPLDDGGALHVSGYSVLAENSRESVSTLLRRWAGPTSVDVCSVAPLRELGPARFLEAVAGATRIMANQEEALALTNTAEVGTAAYRLLDSFEEVLITRGREGALVATRDQVVPVAGLEQPVVDTTGAGDAATGAYLAARLSGAPIDRALDAAMIAGASAVGRVGATD